MVFDAHSIFSWLEIFGMDGLGEHAPGGCDNGGPALCERDAQVGEKGVHDRANF
jgi:hypothetical protein